MILVCFLRFLIENVKQKQKNIIFVQKYTNPNFQKHNIEGAPSKHRAGTEQAPSGHRAGTEQAPSKHRAGTEQAPSRPRAGPEQAMSKHRAGCCTVCASQVTGHTGRVFFLYARATHAPRAARTQVQVCTAYSYARTLYIYIQM